MATDFGTLLAAGSGLIFLRFADVRFAAEREKLEKTSASSRCGSRVDEPAAYPRAYSPDLYKQKCAPVFEHVYERYPDHARSQRSGQV
jgi:hypothetical protein